MELKDKKEKIILAGVHTGCADFLSDTTDESVKELEELVKTAGGEVVGILIQNKSEIETGTYLGTGKLEELRDAVVSLEADVVVFDNELSPIQLKNITDFVGVKVLDRSMLILDIFAMRAKSGEGKRIVIELDGKVYAEYNMESLGSTPKEITISSKYGKNILAIDKYGADMIYSDCPLQIDVNHRKITAPGETIVCAPHKLVVYISGESRFDAVTG